MNDAVRQELARIIKEHGKGLADDPRRCEALLRDYCGQYKREINVLVGALKERVAADLAGSSIALPVKLLIAQLARRLRENLGYSEAASKWAVESWALALGVVSTNELEEEKTSHRVASSTDASGPFDPDDPFIETTPEVSANSSPEEILRQALRIVFADNVATEYEKADLRRIRERLGIPMDMASRMFAEVKAERQQANNNMQVAPSVATLTVSQERDGQFKSIRQAIERAEPGTHILVKPGLYKESLIIDRPVSIIGDGPVEEVIIESAGSPCLVTRAAQINIQGLTLRSFVNDERDSYFAVDISFGQLVLEDCVISSNAGACISIHGPGVNPEIRRCRVRDGGNYGIWIWDDAVGIIEECEISSCAGAGIVISGDTMEEARQMAAHILADISGDQNVINKASAMNRGNTASHSGTNRFPLIRRSDIFGNRDKGVWVHYKGHALIEQCRVFENDAAGVWIDQKSEASIKESNINHNRWEAVRITGNSSATVVDCDLSDNAGGPWMVESGCQLRESGNKV